MSSTEVRRTSESRTIRLSFTLADPGDAKALAELRTSAACDLTDRFGPGHWSGESTERGVLAGMRHANVWVARRSDPIIATFRLAAKKPWAIDRSYFASSDSPLYLTDMAVHPDLQRQGVGRRCIQEAVSCAHLWPADAIRLDAYDADAGAGEFYTKCGFTEVGHAIYRGVPLVYYELLLTSTDRP